MPKRKICAGDLFSIPAPDGRAGYGQVVLPDMLLYVVVFEGLFQGAPPPCDSLIQMPLLIGWTTDALIYHSRWKIVGTCAVPDGLPFPNYKVQVGTEMFVTDFCGKILRRASRDEAEFLDFQFSVSPIVFQNSLLAHHQLGDFQMQHQLAIQHALARCIIPSG